MRKGWSYIYVDLDLSDDFAVSSFQSKYVKFLQFRNNPIYSSVSNFRKVIYVDHKFNLTESHVDILNHIWNRPILIRKTPREKTKIWDEVADANKQERYVRYMPRTLKYIKEKLDNGYSENVRVCNTGLICYSVKDSNVTSLVDEVYADLLRIGTSECQIIWSMVSQRYSEVIQMIDWTDFPILWKTPESSAIPGEGLTL